MTFGRLLGQSVRDAGKGSPRDYWRNRSRDAEHFTRPWRRKSRVKSAVPPSLSLEGRGWKSHEARVGGNSSGATFEATYADPQGRSVSFQIKSSFLADVVRRGGLASVKFEQAQRGRFLMDLRVWMSCARCSCVKQSGRHPSPLVL
jgi:hypothetical protein